LKVRLHHKPHVSRDQFTSVLRARFCEFLASEPTLFFIATIPSPQEGTSMRLTLADVEADEILPSWMADERFPAWSRDTRYRYITEPEYCAALMEVRKGFRDQSSFDKLISARKHNAKRAAKREAERAAESTAQRAESERRKREAQRLARLTSQVTMWRNRVTEAESRGDMLAELSLPSYRVHLRQSQENLGAHIENCLREEFARMNPTEEHTQ
jgi:hypothetical protein